MTTDAAPASDALARIYIDLHQHPELKYQEVRTAGIVAQQLRSVGYSVTTEVGKTGVVGVLDRGAGPTVLLRADMDALPICEETGLDYASTATGIDETGATVPVMHACGHDVHTTCLIGAASALAADPGWRGKLMVVFQPAEEGGAGARAMVNDGLFTRFGTPDVVLGQHVGPLPAGCIGLQPGPAFAASDTLLITLYGAGGHGSRPETTVDPIVMAALLIARLQTIVSRELAGTDTAVVTVGSLHAGGASFNVIPDTAELRLTVRSYSTPVRDKVLATIERMAKAEATASAAPREPEVKRVNSYPAVINDPAACERTSAAFVRDLPQVMVVAPGPVTGSEDVGVLASEANCPIAYWLLGGSDPTLFAGATNVEEIAGIVQRLPSNHSPAFAPVIDPTLRIGVAALTAAAREWLAS